MDLDEFVVPAISILISLVGSFRFWKIEGNNNPCERMDIDDFRCLFESSGVDIWGVIDMALTVASTEFSEEFKARRDQIAARLYASTTSRCQNCDGSSDGGEAARVSGGTSGIGSKPQHKSPRRFKAKAIESHEAEDKSPDDEEEEEGLQKNKAESHHVVEEVLRIKELLDDSYQPQEVLLESLQSLFNMHISVEALKETDIGRQVNGLRKHSSADIRKLVKELIRKWKDLVDEWVSTADEVAAAAIVDGDSPQGGGSRISQQSIVQKCQGSNYLSSPQGNDSNFNGDKMYSESHSKGKTVKQGSTTNVTNVKTVSRNNGDIERTRNDVKQKETILKAGSAQKCSPDISPSERFASAKRRLQEKYQEAENAKRQRTVQVMELQDLPKPRNTFISHGRGGNQNRHRFSGK